MNWAAEFTQPSIISKSPPSASLSLPSTPKQRNLMNDKVADKANKKMGDRCNAAAGLQAGQGQGATRGEGGLGLKGLLTGLVINYEPAAPISLV